MRDVVGCVPVVVCASDMNLWVFNVWICLGNL